MNLTKRSRYEDLTARWRERESPTELSNEELFELYEMVVNHRNYKLVDDVGAEMLRRARVMLLEERDAAVVRSIAFHVLRDREHYGHLIHRAGIETGMSDAEVVLALDRISEGVERTQDGF